MMARSTTRSNQRPDTLMQDRRRQFDEIFLQRTAGPYKRVKLRSLSAQLGSPLCPQQRASSARPIRSEKCQYRKYRTRRCGVGRSSETFLAFNPTDEERTYGCERLRM